MTTQTETGLTQRFSWPAQLPSTGARLPALLGDQATTREEQHVARATRLHLAQVAGTAAKAAYGQAAVAHLATVTYQHGMRATAEILACREQLVGQELQQYGAAFAEGLIHQTHQHLGAIAAITARHIAEIVDQSLDPPPPPGLLERLWNR